MFSLKSNGLNKKREPLKTSVFGGFLTPWRKLHFCNLLYNKELAIFSKEPLETQPGFPEVPYSLCLQFLIRRLDILGVTALQRRLEREPALGGAEEEPKIV
ncbi:MAG: hypothetical protein LBC31_00900, partial [Treponema sp.]|nr:hypothetical protein [Treponema sp.]